VASTKPLDGISLKPLLLGEPSGPDERLIFSHWGNRVSVKSGTYRLDDKGKLYDLASDPGQRTDVTKEHPALAARLREAVKAWRAEVLTGYNNDNRPFLIGHPGATHTHLPARDGKPHGNIQRSSKFPNASFFQNWTSVEDRITWDAEVAEDGRFEVSLYHTCAPDAVGTELELSMNGRSLTHTITEAHDPPLHGAAEDRVPRMESYVKDFKALSMGTLALPKGPGELTLRATKIPGKQAIDFRLLILKRLE
jgi:hypothetical protein